MILDIEVREEHIRNIRSQHGENTQNTAKLFKTPRIFRKRASLKTRIKRNIKRNFRW